MRFFTQSATLLLASFLVLIIISTPLTGYMVPILGFVIALSVIFIIIRQRGRDREDLFVGSNKEVFTLTVALLLAIFLTGGLTSNLFFLLYFLLFGIAFVYKPEAVFVLLLGLGVVFLQSALAEGEPIDNLIKLGSLALFSPIFYFFGREFGRRKKLAEEIEDKTGQILEDAKVLRSQADEDEADEIEDIEEKATDLRRQAEKND